MQQYRRHRVWRKQHARIPAACLAVAHAVAPRKKQRNGVINQRNQAT